MPAYTYTFNSEQFKKFLENIQAAKLEKLLDSDPSIRVNAKRRVVEVDYLPSEFSNYAVQIRYILNDALKVTPQQAIELYGSDECKAIVKEDRFLDARESYRDFEKKGGYPDPPIDSGVKKTQTKKSAIEGMLGKAPGFCFGERHGKADDAKAIADSLDQGVGMLFIEEFSEVVQPDIEEYLKGGEMSPRLEERAKTTGFLEVLQKAREKGAKVYGIDSPDAARNTGDRRELQERLAKMNRASEAIMRKAIAENPDLKFMAVAGEAHCNTGPGGIPGLAQMFKIPSVKLSDNGNFEDLPENPEYRTLPSKEELRVIDEILKRVPKNETVPNQGAVDGNDVILLQAVAQAKQLKTAGKLKDDEATTELLQSEEIVKLVQDTRLEVFPDAAKKQIAQAVKDNDLPRLRRILAKDPTAANAEWSPGSGSGVTVMHVAAQLGLDAAVGELLGAGGDPNLVDTNGNTPLHFAAAQRPEKMDPRDGVSHDDVRKGQSDAIARLIATGRVDPDAQNKEGKTAMHLAAWNNNTQSLETLFNAGASATIPDNRGWTPLNTAIASTKVEAETFFYDKGIDPNASPIPPTGKLSTVDLLCQATQCENPDDVAKIRQHYEDLYSNKLLRPIMDLAAADAGKPRKPPDGGLRFFVANGDNAGQLYNAVGDVPPEGAYDEGAHVLVISNKSSKDLQGTLIHELTHAAARMVHGDDVIPAKPGLERDAYKLAIEGDVKRMALASPVESEQTRTISGRMDEYVMKARKRATNASVKAGFEEDSPETRRAVKEEVDKTLMQEFLVGIPQLIAEHGEDYVTGLAPQLTAYFKTFSSECAEVTRKDPRFSDVSARLDNSAYEGRRRNRPELSYTVTESDSAGLAGVLLEKVAARYKVDVGRPNIPGGASNIAYSHDLYELTPDQQKSMDQRMKVVTQVFKKLLATPGGLPPELRGDTMKDFAEEIARVAAGNPKEIEALVQRKAGEFARAEKLKYVDRRLDADPPPTDWQLAESIVLRAEQAVLGDGDGALEVDASKQKAIIQELADKLAKLPVSAKTNPGNLKQLTDAVSTGPTWPSTARPRRSARAAGTSASTRRRPGGRGRSRCRRCEAGGPARYRASGA